jgi:hypothetical protein
MTKPLQYLLGCVVAVLFVAIVVPWVLKHRADATVSRMETLNTQLQEQISDLKGQSNEALQRADQEKTQRIKLEASLQAAQSRVDAARLKVKSHGPADIIPALPHDQVLGLVDDQGSLIAAQDDLNTQKDGKIASLEAEVVDLRTALDLSQHALTVSEQRARALEIAIQAQKSATTSSKWIGRVQGFAIGIGVGYVGGRFK